MRRGTMAAQRTLVVSALLCLAMAAEGVQQQQQQLRGPGASASLKDEVADALPSEADASASSAPRIPRTYGVPPAPGSRVNTSIEYSQEALADEVVNLPGLSRENLNYRQFAGYLPLDQPSKQIFYWFVESQSRPDSDPVVFWTNGGPGGSGLYGLFVEHGPFRATEKGEGLEVNPHSWNRVANMLYVEQPVGVGFSKSGPNDHTLSDETVAADNYRLIQAFLDRFKHLRSNELFLAGESYAGHYVPQLAKQITEENAKGTGPKVNLKGFAVGNPLTDPVESFIGMIQTFGGAQLLPRDTYYSWLTTCGASTKPETQQTQKCRDLGQQLSEYVDNTGWNFYAISYPTCKPGQTGFARRRHRRLTSSKADASHRLAPLLDLEVVADTALDAQPCQEEWTTSYLNRKEVKTAIHADEKTRWSAVNTSVWSLYSHDDQDTFIEPLYDHFLTEYNPKAPDGGIRILVYSGDNDAVCSTAGTQLWINERKWAPASEWVAWGTGNGWPAGYVQNYKGNFTFATVHGAGHMVPFYKPQAALGLFAAFLSDNL